VYKRQFLKAEKTGGFVIDQSKKLIISDISKGPAVKAINPITHGDIKRYGAITFFLFIFRPVYLFSFAYFV